MQLVNKNPSDLTAALVAFQADLPKVTKTNTATVPTKTGGQYTYKYADLAEVSALVLPLLAAHGMAWTCLPEFVDGRFQLRGQLRHVGGETIEATWPLPTDGNPQTLGGSLTYGRRYLLTAVTGVAADEDDDAQLAAGRAQRSQVPAAPPLVSAGQLKDLGIALGEYGLVNRDDRLTFVSGLVGRDLASSKELTVTEAVQVIRTVREQIATDKATDRAETPPAPESP